MICLVATGVNGPYAITSYAAIGDPLAVTRIEHCGFLHSVLSGSTPPQVLVRFRVLPRICPDALTRRGHFLWDLWVGADLVLRYFRRRSVRQFALSLSRAATGCTASAPL